MSLTSDHVVVPFATFVERREGRNRVATALRERDRSDATVKSASAVAVPITTAEIRGVLEPTGIDAEKGECS